MGAKGPQVPLPRYHPKLLDRGGAWASDESHDDCFRRLVRHYGLGTRFGVAVGLDAMLPPQEPDLEAWRELAFRLVLDFVPAFRRGRRPGRKKAPLNPNAFFAATAEGSESVQQARFVLAVRALVNGRSINAALRDLEKSAQKRKFLPYRYRGLTTFASLRQAYYQSIPKGIRNDPDHTITVSKIAEALASRSRFGGLF